MSLLKHFKSNCGRTHGYILLLINIGMIIHEAFFPERAVTVVLVYWCQSMAIGIFYFLRIRAMPNEVLKDNNDQEKVISSKKAAFSFFLFFSAFHALYLYLLLKGVFVTPDMQGRFEPPIYPIVIIAAILFAVDIRQRIQPQIKRDIVKKMSPTIALFSPYPRVLPMHIAILLSAFTGNGIAFIEFLVFKLLIEFINWVLFPPDFSEADKINCQVETQK